MGNKIISPIKDILKKYFNDIDDSKINLTILKGSFKLENLHMNNNVINSELTKKKIPLKLKFGMLSKMELKVSVLSAKLEYIDIEDMILMVQPNYKIHNYFNTDGNSEEELIVKVLNNLKKYKNGEQFSNIFEEADSYTPSPINKSAKDTPNASVINKDANEKKQKNNKRINIFGPEFTSIIENILQFRIRIKNVKIIYDDTEILPTIKNGCFNEDVTFGIVLEDLVLQNEDYNNYMDMSTGKFKDFINLLNFFHQSGSASMTDILLLAFNIRRFSFSLCYDVPFNFSIPDRFPKEQNVKMKADIIEKFNVYFSTDNKKLLNMFILENLGIDFLFLFKPSHTIPIQALFILFNVNSFDFNIELKHLRTFTDVIAFIINLANSRPHKILKPITRAKAEVIKSLLKENYDDELLSELNSLIIKEYFELYNWTNYFKRINKLTKDVNVSEYIYKQSYIQRSLIYYLLFKNPNYQKVFNYKEYIDCNVSNDKKEDPELKEKIETEKNEYMDILSKIHFHVRLRFNSNISYYNKNFEKEINFKIEDFIVDIGKWSGKNKAQIWLNLKQIKADYFYKSNEKNEINKKVDIFNMNLNSKIKSKIDNTDNNDKIKVDNIFMYKDLNINIELQLENIKKNKIYIIEVNGDMGNLCSSMSPVFLENIFKIANAFFKDHYSKMISNFISIGYTVPSINFNNLSPLLNTYLKRTDSNLKDLKKIENLMFTEEIKIMMDKKKRLKEIEKELEEENNDDNMDRNEPEKDVLSEMNKMIIELEKKLQNISVSINLKTPKFNIKLSDEKMDEILKIDMYLGIIRLELDIMFKEKCLAEAFGCVIESKYPLKTLLPFTKKMIGIIENAIDKDIVNLVKFYKLKGKKNLNKMEREYIDLYSSKRLYN